MICMRCFSSKYKPEVESINFLSLYICTALVTSHQYPAAQIQQSVRKHVYMTYK